MRTTVIVAAAGQGKRMGSNIPKQYLQLGNDPILVHTINRFEKSASVDEVIIVVGEGEIESIQEMSKKYHWTKVTHIVTGGKERQHSVSKGLEVAKGKVIAVHDGARPLVKEETIDAVIREAELFGAAIVAVPVKDTIKEVNVNNEVVTTPDRKRLWAVQTPQAFRRDILIQAFQKAEKDQFLGTDESSLVERMGHSVRVVQGDYENIKITTPEDMDVALTFMKKGEFN